MIQSCTSCVYKKPEKKLFYEREGAVDSQAHFRSKILQKCQKCLVLALLLPCCPRTGSSKQGPSCLTWDWPDKDDSVRSSVFDTWCFTFPSFDILRNLFFLDRKKKIANNDKWAGSMYAPCGRMKRIKYNKAGKRQNQIDWFYHRSISLQSWGTIVRQSMRRRLQTETPRLHRSNSLYFNCYVLLSIVFAVKAFTRWVYNGWMAWRCKMFGCELWETWENEIMWNLVQRKDKRGKFHFFIKELYHGWFWVYFRTLAGQFEALLQMLAPPLRRQSSN